MLPDRGVAGRVDRGRRHQVAGEYVVAGEEGDFYALSAEAVAEVYGDVIASKVKWEKATDSQLVMDRLLTYANRRAIFFKTPPTPPTAHR